MALLPQKVGSLTLVRALENDGVCQSYVGILDDAAGTQMIARQLLPALGRDEVIHASVRARIDDLLPVRHPALVPITHAFDHGGDLYVANEWADTVTLEAVVAWCRSQDEPLPLHLFLHFAVQICNALDALHAATGAATDAPNVLHHQIRPSSVTVTREGRIALGDYGLLPGPTFATQTGGFRLKTAYLAPEQTHADARQVRSDDDDSEGGLRHLSPASDLFSLGAVLYELLVHKPMFRSSTPLRTLAMVRRAEVTTQLLEVKEVFPGVDRILYRALSLHPRHRYQRAFVLREDLRGLMAEFSFSNIDAECRAFLAPLFKGTRRAVDDLLPRRPSPVLDVSETEPTVLARIDVDAIRRGLDLSPEAARDAFPDDFDDDPLDYGGVESAPTGAFDAPSSSFPIERPIQYAADDPDDDWSDVQPSAPPRRDARAIRDALGERTTPDEPPPTEEQDLEPVDVPSPSLPPAALRSQSVPNVHVHDPHAETQILPVEPTSTLSGLPPTTTTTPSSSSSSSSSPVGMVLGAGVASLVAVAITLCASGGLLVALATQRTPTADEPIQPASRRLLHHPTGTRAWRSVPTSTARPPPLGPVPAAIRPAVEAMDDGSYRAALEVLATLDVASLQPTARLLAAEIEGNAHRALFERSTSREPSHLASANAAWTTYQRLAGDDPARGSHAAAHLAHLAALQR